MKTEYPGRDCLEGWELIHMEFLSKEEKREAIHEVRKAQQWNFVRKNDVLDVR